MSEWIKISDRKPPNGVYVLIANFDGRPKVEMHFISIAERLNDQWFDDKNGDVLNPKYGTVTHWMPLPDKPTEKKDY